MFYDIRLNSIYVILTFTFFIYVEYIGVEAAVCGGVEEDSILPLTVKNENAFFVVYYCRWSKKFFAQMEKPQS